MFLCSSLTPRVILAVIITLIAVFIITSGLPSDGLTPDMATRIQKDYILPLALFAPEPRERTIYLIALFLLPTLIMTLTVSAWNYGRSHVNANCVWRSCLHPGWKTLGAWSLPTLLYSTMLFARESPFGSSFGFGSYTIVQDVVFSGRIPLFLLLAWFFYRVAYTGFYRTPVSLARFSANRQVRFLADLFAIAGILYVTAKLSLLVETIGADEYSEYWSSLIHMGPIFEPAVTAYLSKSA
ncbi:hypothetical protein, partial [uncultured Thiodictyon sp.]|uniref:hypothetical protein n=1 Tax=uncultured Thiodictyon sp. TaxID=1846217 RepID=UPI0025D73038